jgi:hypothetical protein
LSYRLRIRVAHLLATGLESKQDVKRTVRDLYKQRSMIVHDGKYEITDLELRTIRSIAKQSIVRISTDPIFRTMNTPNDFANWFDQQILN